jgi:bacterioferritin-associated ferredoxin
MPVCHCRRLTDRAIREAIQGGAKTTEEVGDSCGAGTGCGGCIPAVSALLATEADHRHSSLPVLCAPRESL